MEQKGDAGYAFNRHGRAAREARISRRGELNSKRTVCWMLERINNESLLVVLRNDYIEIQTLLSFIDGVSERTKV